MDKGYNLKNKVAIVTGAGSGIGKAVALRLAEEEAKVVLNGRNKEKLEKAASEIKGETLVIAGDVGESKDVKKLVSETIQHFGKVDILVNNAGIIRLNTVLETSEKDWDELFRVNAKGVFLCCKEVAKHMIKQGYGKIINISSLSGKLGAPLNAAYCASKAAVILFTQSLALELAKYKINVNSVCPGGTTDTEMRLYVDNRYKELGVPNPNVAPPLGKMVTPFDVAEVVLFLASAKSDMMTGQAINVTGGAYFA